MKRYWLFAILLLAAALRLYGLDRGDTVNDEVFYGFRGLGWIDYDRAETQKTPLEWWDPRATGGATEIPWWTKLSFHDHPPLVFAVQNIFMRVFGDSTFAERLPSAILGVASAYLVYLIGTILFSEIAGLISAAFLAVTLNHIYISRVGMQEAYVIFFMLFASYLFLKALKNDKYLIWTGVFLGFAFLTKYNAFILVPIFLAYLAFYKRGYFLNKKLWLGALIAFLIFSPVIIYNIMMYRAVGHFDFQISYILGQEHPEWPSQPGKELGTLGDRLKNLVPRLIATNSWIFLGLFAGSLIFLRNAFLWLIFIFLFLLLMLIGPSYRFLTMLTPWMALSIGNVAEHYFFAFLAAAKQPSGLPAGKTRSKTMLVGLIFAILLFEIFYSYNNQIAYYPKGSTPLFSSKVRYENYNWGYNELEDYLNKEFSAKMPALTFVNRYQFLDDLQDNALAKARAKGLEPYPALLVYYGNIDEGPKLWILEKLHIYHGWPIITFDTYGQFLQDEGPAYYKKSGFKNYYFIEAANSVAPPEFRNIVGEKEPLLIRNPRGDIVFKVYKFENL